MNIVGSEDNVDPRRPLANDLFVLLGRASTDGDAHVRVLLLVGLQRPEISVEALVGVLSDRARVQDNDLGLSRAARTGHPIGFEKTRYPL